MTSDRQVSWAGEVIAREVLEAAVAKQCKDCLAAGTRFDWMELRHLLSPGARRGVASAADLVKAWQGWKHADPCAPRTHADGYDDDLYGDEADRAALDAMAETRREAVLSERREARQAAAAAVAATAVAAAAAAEEEEEEDEEEPSAKKSRADTFKLGSETVTRQQLEAVVASERAAGRAIVWAGLWSKLLARGGSKPTNTKNIRRNWERWHPDEAAEEAGDEGEAEAKEEEEAKDALFSFGEAKVSAAALNEAVAAHTKTADGRRTCEWEAAAAAAAPSSGMMPDAAARLAKRLWEGHNKQAGAPAPAA
jgi:hypothetical protein